LTSARREGLGTQSPWLIYVFVIGTPEPFPCGQRPITSSPTVSARALYRIALYGGFARRISF